MNRKSQPAGAREFVIKMRDLFEGFSKMKKFALIPIIIILLGLFVVSYSDYVTIKTRRYLYSESARIQERITKYEKLLNETDKLRAKVEILKRKRLDDNELNKMIDGSG